MGGAVAYKTLVSATVTIGIGIRGLGLGLDNSLLNVVWHAHYFVSQLFNEVELGHSI